MRIIPFALLLAMALLMVGCATHIKPSSDTNPPPGEKFSSFSRFELLPLQAATPAVANQKSAMAKIEESIQNLLGKRLQALNAKPAAGTGRTLVIEPVVTELKFVGGGARFFAGAMAGSSAVILKAKFTEKDSGRLIAHPEFYSLASAMSGAWSIGGNDNGMLVRIANWLAVYFLRNYPQAVGGPVVSEEIKAESISLD